MPLWLTVSTEVVDPLVFLMTPVATVLLRELTVAFCPNKSSAPTLTTSGFGPATGPSAVPLPSWRAVTVPLPFTVMPPVKPELFPFRMTLPVEVDVIVSGELPLTAALTVRLFAVALIHDCAPPSTRPVVLIVTGPAPVCMFRLLFSVRVFDKPPIVTSVVAVELKTN